MTDWTRVTPAAPCPVCGKPDWCGFTDTVARCMRVESDHPSNGGWIHRIADARKAYQPRPAPPRPIDMTPDRLQDLLTAWQDQTPPGALAGLADSLGLPVPALRALTPAWSEQRGAWGFPMRSATGELRGIRLRFPDGAKRAVTGSRDGLFLPFGAPTSGPLLILEGPTDTAAAVALDYAAVGRPSCRGATAETVAYARHWPGPVVIVADNDEPHATPDGTAWTVPGFDGAIALREAIPAALLVALPTKDLREFWRLHGVAGRRMLDSIIGNA